MTAEINPQSQDSFSAGTGSVALSARTQDAASRADTGGPRGNELKKQVRIGESIIQGLLFACGALSILTTVGLVIVLALESSKFFVAPEVSFIDFVTDTMWQPQIERFGVLPLLNATLMVSGIAMVVALPLGLFAAILLSEYAPPRLRATLKPILEVLAGVPTVVYGYFALTFMTPTIQSAIKGIGSLGPLIGVAILVVGLAFAGGLMVAGARIKLREQARTGGSSGGIGSFLIILGTLLGSVVIVIALAGFLTLLFGTTVQIYNTLSAGVVVGILVIPLIASMSEDALRAVPQSLREAAYGLGGTRLEVVLRVVVPGALSGLTAAFIVAISRAVGETMIVAIAAGAGPNLTWNPFQSAETITGHINRISGGDLSYNSIDYQSIFALAALLFVMTLLLNIISRWVMRKFREAY